MPLSVFPNVQLEALAQSAVRAVAEQRAKLLVIFTGSGRMVRLAAKYRPQCPIVAVGESCLGGDRAAAFFLPYEIGPVLGLRTRVFSFRL